MNATAKATKTPIVREVAPQIVSVPKVDFPHASEAIQVFLRPGGKVAHLFPPPQP